MHLSENGEIVKNELIKMGTYNQRAMVDEWVVMPNHVHCIIILGAIDDGDVEKIHEFSLRHDMRHQPLANGHHPAARQYPFSLYANHKFFNK